MNKRTKMEIADDLSNSELIELIEQRGYIITKMNDNSGWGLMGIKINGKDVYHNTNTNNFAIEEDYQYLRYLLEDEVEELKQKLDDKNE